MFKVIIPKESLNIVEYTSRSIKTDIDSTLCCKVDYIASVSYSVAGSMNYPSKYMYNTHTGMLVIITSFDLNFITDIIINFHSSCYLRDAKLDKLLQ